jgi:peptidyl-prolyl cis-trans isomerase D
MLDVFRQHSRSLAVKILYGAITFVFVFWGVGVMVGGDKVNVAAMVDGEPISAQEYARAQERMERMYREVYRESMNPQILAQLNLGQRALDDLVIERLLKREAERLGLQVTDDEVRESILEIPTFQDGSRFDRTRYLNVLRASRISPTEFEESQRETLLVGKLEGLLTDGLTVSDQEVKDLHALESEKVDVSFVKVPFSNFKEQSTVSDAEVSEYYDKNQERFRRLETVTVAYVPYAPEHFGEKLAISDEAIKDYYDAHQEDYEQPERLKLQHILFTVPADADDAAKAAVTAKAAAVLVTARIGGTKEFAELAKTNSEDELTKENGGDLGIVSRGTLEAPLEEAAFKLGVGEVSDPVTSSRGIHLIRVEEKIAGGPKPLEEVREEIVKTLRDRGADDAARNALTADLEAAKGGKTLEEIAASHGLTVTTSAPHSRNQQIPGVRSTAMVINGLAMEVGAIDQVMDPEPPYYLFKVTEKTPSVIPPLEDVRQTIVDTLTKEKTREAAKTAAEALLTAARTANTADALLAEAKAKGFEVDSTGPFSRNEPIPKLAPAPIQNEVFALTAKAPLGSGAHFTPDAAVVVALKERIPADESTLTDEKKQSLRDQAVARKRQDVLESYRNSLRERAEITVNPDVMARTS